MDLGRSAVPAWALGMHAKWRQIGFPALVLALKTARYLSFTSLQSILPRADRVIE